MKIMLRFALAPALFASTSILQAADSSASFAYDANETVLAAVKAADEERVAASIAVDRRRQPVELLDHAVLLQEQRRKAHTLRDVQHDAEGAGLAVREVKVGD